MSPAIAQAVIGLKLVFAVKTGEGGKMFGAISTQMPSWSILALALRSARLARMDDELHLPAGAAGLVAVIPSHAGIRATGRLFKRGRRSVERDSDPVRDGVFDDQTEGAAP